MDNQALEPLYSTSRTGIVEIYSEEQLKDIFFTSPDTAQIKEKFTFREWIQKCCKDGVYSEIKPLESQTIFGKLIEKVRQEKNISSSKLSAACLISKEQLKWIEAGRLYPDANTLQWISNVLGIYKEDLISGKITLKPNYEECRMKLRESQDLLLQTKEHLNVIDHFAEQAHLYRYEVREKEEV